MTRRIYVKPLLPPDQLGPRQERIVNGLLREGVPLEEIRGLPWYDPRLEAFYVDRYANSAANTANRDMDVSNEPTDVRHGGDPDENGPPVADPDDKLEKRKAYQRDLMRKRRAEKRGG